MDSTDLAYAGIARQAELIAAGELSPVDLADLYLSRIDRLNPALNAFRVVFAERARAEAKQAQARLGAGDRSRPLLGVPIAVKDDTDVAGEYNGYGSLGHGPAVERDAELVARLRAAGAVVLGKTNVPELMIFPFTESEAFGATRNPWDITRTPGGSSGGAAAAVAAGLVGAAVGSDGGGSIRIPSACCGLFGVKPQRDRVPLVTSRPSDGWHGLGVAGPLARSVGDAALLLDVLAAAGGEFAAAAGRAPGRLRIAVSRKLPSGMLAPLDPACAEALARCAELLRELGHEVVEEDPDYGLLLPSFLARYVGGVHTEARAMAQPGLLESRTRGMARLGALVGERGAAWGREREAEDAARVFSIFDSHDVLLTPTLAQLPPKVGRWQGRGALWTLNGVARFTPYTAVWNHLGNPAASIPFGFTGGGLPLAVQLVARPSDEVTLFSLAGQIEAARPWGDRRPALAP
jgi:amidase